MSKKPTKQSRLTAKRKAKQANFRAAMRKVREPYIYGDRGFYNPPVQVGMRHWRANDDALREFFITLDKRP